MDDLRTVHEEATEGGYDVAPEYAPITPASVPVDVVGAVRVEAQPTRKMSTGQVELAVGARVKVANAHPARVSLRLRAVGGDFFIGDQEGTASFASGFPLPDGELITLTTRYEVWVWAMSAGIVCYLAEHLDG